LERDVTKSKLYSWWN